MNKKNKPNKVNQLARSGDPSKRSQVPQAKIQKAKANAREKFLRITGLVVIASLAATLLVGMFNQF